MGQGQKKGETMKVYGNCKNPTLTRYHKGNLRDRDTYLNADDYWGDSYREEIRLKIGYACPECKESVLSYNKPKKCSDHE